MSVLGDYVHLWYPSYEKYGVNKYKQSGKPSLESVLIKQRQLNQDRIDSLPEIDSSILGELKTRVKKNIPAGKDLVLLNENLVENIEKLIDTFKVFLKENVTAAETLGIKNNINNLDFDKSKVKVEEAKHARDLLYSTLKTAEKNFHNGKPIQNSTITAIIKNFNNFFKAMGAAQKEGGVSLLTPEQIKNIDTVSAIKLLVQDISFAEAHKSTTEGIVGETVTQICRDRGYNLALETVYKEIKNDIKGSNVSTFQIIKSQVSSAVAKEYSKITKDNIYKVKSSQNKVDVSITVNKTPLNISVKNYSSSSNNKITVGLQDANFFTSLVTTVDDFANHWLNLHVANRKPFSINRDVEEALGDHIKYEALVSGNLLKQNVSLTDTFLAMDSNKGLVYAVSTKDILKGTAKGSSIYFSNKSDFENWRIKNDKESTWARRIAKILVQLRQSLIHVMMNVQLEEV